MAVSINPGTTTFERIPSCPHSLAVSLEKASNAPLLDAYIANPLYPVWALIDEICIIEPFFLDKSILRSTYFVIIIGVKTFTLYIAFSLSILRFVTISSYAMAALFTYPSN